jgi:hypothetical protein
MVTRLKPWWVLVSILAVFGVTTIGVSNVFSANTRPISDFIEQQGTYCINDGSGGCFLFVPPVENFIGWNDPANNRSASVDYAGLANKYLTTNGYIDLDTSFSGTIIELPLKDGRAEVKIVLHTKNALTWVIEGEDYANGPLLFGYRPTDVQAGATPVLADITFKVVFINTAPGAPLPDLIQLVVAPEDGQELRFIAMRAQAAGPLREAFGVQDGTPGRATIIQTGLFMTPFMGAVSDGFPVDRIDLKVVGKGK